MAKENASRISLQRKLPKVNRNLAQRLLDHADQKRAKGGKEGGEDEDASMAKLAANPLGDDRFGALFNNPAFSIDTTSEEYKSLHPSLVLNYFFFFKKILDACIQI